jgi:hypothetical protein
LLPLVTPCCPLLPLVTPCYPLLPLVAPCYPLLPLVTPCYPLLPLVTTAYRELFPLSVYGRCALVIVLETIGTEKPTSLDALHLGPDLYGLNQRVSLHT